MSSIKTVGELRDLIKDLPDDMAVGGYDGMDHPDYVQMDFYVHKRTDDPDWAEYKKSDRMVSWWEAWGEVPDAVFVCSTD